MKRFSSIYPCLHENRDVCAVCKERCDHPLKTKKKDLKKLRRFCRIDGEIIPVPFDIVFAVSGENRRGYFAYRDLRNGSRTKWGVPELIKASAKDKDRVGFMMIGQEKK